MANWLNQLQSLLGQSSSSTSSSADQGLVKLLVPGALGGLAGLLVANKSARKLLTKYGTNALLVGGGAVAGTVLWNKYKDKIRAAHQDEPQFGAQSTPLDERTARLILALVFAAKSDGHIDAKERAAIDQQLRGAGVEEQGRVLIEQAIEQPLDPQRLATGVRNEEEALEIYFLSCAAIDIDHFMERSYLNALGDALKIPQDVRDGIERDLEQQKRTLAEQFRSLDSLKLTISGYPESHSHLNRLIFSVCITFDIRAITCHHLSNDSPVSLASPVSFATLIRCFNQKEQ